MNHFAVNVHLVDSVRVCVCVCMLCMYDVELCAGGDVTMFGYLACVD